MKFEFSSVVNSRPENEITSVVQKSPSTRIKPMQTLRKRTSPCKYKNDPSRFLGEGITFKAKLIGILEVSEARGDKMCQDALNDLKTAIRAAGEHKQRITISISIDGLRLRDEKTGDCLYHHPVHKISFIAQDMSDSRAFGYIFGSPDTGHRFFGIKTDKTASQVVISMRDLFQVVFELKKREIEMTKNLSDSHFAKFGTPSFLDSVHFTKEELEKAKAKYANVLKSRCAASKSSESNISEYKGSTSEAIADLLDLEHELNSIQQGINQMDKITPSDPFGPLSKGELYIDPFDDSFSSKSNKPSEEKVSAKTHASTYHLDEQPDQEKQSFLPTSTSTNKTFFSQFSPGIGKSKAEDSKWFDQETESLFSETVNVNNLEPTSSPVTLNAPSTEPVQVEDKKSPVKTDLFTDLDPLGTGRVKPYVDKKDFFQELKNPPKKVLKELIGENSTTEPTFFFSPNLKEDNKTPSTAKSDSAQSTSTVDSIQGFRENSLTPKYMKIDPFEDGDPFDKTDPFQGESFSVGEFPPLFNTKSSMDGLFDDKPSWKFDANNTSEDKSKNSPSNLSLFSTGALRVSLPPEKSSGSPTSKLKSPGNSPEDLKGLKRRNYQTLKQNTLEGNEDSLVYEETFFCTKITPGSKEFEKKSPFKKKLSSLQSPPSFKADKSRTYSSFDVPEVPSTPEPPPRNKTALFSIKPPPLPPKKANQLLKPPARPPSIDSSTSYYDSLEKKEIPKEENHELKCVKLKKQLFTGKTSPPSSELKKQNSNSDFPVLLPPPNRKASTDGSKITSARKMDKAKTTSDTPGSILNIKLNQLDNTGLENLAITLGVPSENIYSMTLQELTKMLAGKYLTNAEAKPEEPKSDTFEVDFDANFAKMEMNPDPPPPSYDKYAVFKELIENESKPPEIPENLNNNENPKMEDPEVTKEDLAGPMEDKYAALRQLSLKPETYSEDLDDEEVTVRPSSVSDVNPSSENFPPATNTLAPDVSDTKSSWAIEDKNEISETNDAVERRKSIEQEASKFPNESQLFPLVDEFSDDRKLASPRDNWATFEKPDFEGLPGKKSESFNENENSPFSSDGKECGDFHWYKKNYRKNTRKDVPWKDDDESWDDNSPKESFCSDESSHEEPSPDAGRVERYEKWNLCKKPPKMERKWNEKGTYWGHRGAWQEETEDEFEETWRKREKSYGPDRKFNFWHNACENYSKRYECYNTRDEPWDENERRAFCCGSRRKRSESDTEFRKRCDSDVSDKECVWSSQKNYPDSLGRSGKQKQYYSSAHSYRECSDYCHESRSKHRKGATQKRPSSTSDSKRNFEKLNSPGEYSCRGLEKTYAGKPDKDEYKYQYCKDYRHRAEEEYPHYYKSYDRKVSSHHSKAGSRSNRASSSGQIDMYSSFGKRSQADFGSFEPLEEDSFKHGKSASPSHFQFDSEAENFEKTRKSEQLPQDFQTTSERLANQWASTNGKTDEKNGFFTARNSNEGFANFKEEFKMSPRSSKTNGKQEQRGPEAVKPQMKTKPHLPILGRQESSTTLRKSDSINIFSRDNDPFEGDDFFSSAS